MSTTTISSTYLLKQSASTRIRRALLVVALFSVFCISFYLSGLYEPLVAVLRKATILSNLSVVHQILVAIAIAALLWRIALVLRYRSIPGCSDEKLPTTTIIVPAYNEGKQVMSTLESLVNSDYPAEKLSIVAVDDGSQDDTWQWLKRAKAKFPDRIELVRCRQNRGKRHALYTGFQRSKSSIVATVDSDSQVYPCTIRNLVSPFVDSPHVGAVAGNVRVLNRSKGWIPKLLDVTFTYGCEFLRASESSVNTVMCTPGALSAYRRELLMQIAPQWLDQHFLGRPVVIGDDRALTNMILRLGYHVLFQSNAVVLTEVPVTYTKLCRMFLRWGRSVARETFVLAGFAFGKFRPDSKLGARINLSIALLRLVTYPFVFALMLISFAMYPGASTLLLVVGALIAAFIPATVYEITRGEGRGLLAVPYFLFSGVGLSWISPYALFTMRKSSWMTRTYTPPLPIEKVRATTAPA